jgi:hypothetical protein
MLNAPARFKAHAGEYLRGIPPQVGCTDAICATSFSCTLADARVRTLRRS